MRNWLDQLKMRLDAARLPVSFFFRDDDAGWDDDGLFRLLNIFVEHDVPLDLAVIPRAISPELTSRLQKLLEIGPGLISVHQHGYAHINHEVEGRKYEFGPGRSRSEQLSDIEAGRRLLKGQFGRSVAPVFTPPWNRCTYITGECLVQTGFEVLSRDSTATPLDIPGLLELPVSVDWLKRRQGLRIDINEIGNALAVAAFGGAPVGVMLHHAALNEDDRERVGELLAVLNSHQRAQCCLMTSVISELGMKSQEADASLSAINRNSIQSIAR
jgi:peptidoglycan/xylan/chitin deacetylase (PgdA/CDA1 family)